MKRVWMNAMMMILCVLAVQVLAANENLMDIGNLQSNTNTMMWTVFSIMRTIAAGIIIILAAYKIFQAVTGNAPPTTWYTIIFMAIGTIVIWNAPAIFGKLTGVTADWAVN